MKDIKDLKKRAGQLSQSELSSMKFMLQELKNMIETPQITEEGYRRLVNVSKEFENLKEVYSFRIIKLIKQNHMI